MTEESTIGPAADPARPAAPRTDNRSADVPRDPGGPPALADVPAGESDRDWREEYLREVAQSRKYRQRAQRVETELEQIRQRALSEEQFQEYHQLRQQAATRGQAEARVRAMEAVVRDVVGMSELTSALVACGVGSDGVYGPQQGRAMLRQAAGLLAGRIRVDTDGESPVASVLDETGEVMTDAEGQPVAVEDFVRQWLAKEGGHFLPPSGDTGSGARKGEAAPWRPSVEQLDRDPRAKAEFIARHGPQAYVRLTRRGGK